eukprot:COSAG05_NODE_4171_length_1641_cov_72.164073_1_plen_239_part_10
MLKVKHLRALTKFCSIILVVKLFLEPSHHGKSGLWGGFVDNGPDRQDRERKHGWAVQERQAPKLAPPLSLSTTRKSTQEHLNGKEQQRGGELKQSCAFCHEDNCRAGAVEGALQLIGGYCLGFCNARGFCGLDTPGSRPPIFSGSGSRDCRRCTAALGLHLPELEPAPDLEFEFEPESEPKLPTPRAEVISRCGHCQHCSAGGKELDGGRCLAFCSPDGLCEKGPSSPTSQRALRSYHH